MNFHNLVCILEVWKCGSINKAAQNLFTSQSNLSHAIRALENELGFFHAGIYPISESSSCLWVPGCI